MRHRAGYLDRRPVDVLESSRQEKALRQLLRLRKPLRSCRWFSEPAYFFDSSPSARVLVEARIQAEKMAFRKKGAGNWRADINVMGVAYAEDGSIAARFSETLPISIEKEKETEFRRSGYEYRNYFKLRPGKYRLRLAASDESGNLGSAEQLIEIPPMSDQGITLSSLVIADQISPLSDLIRNIRTQLLDENDPLLYSGMQIRPSVDNKIKTGFPISVLFRIYNSNLSNLIANAVLWGSGGEKFTTPQIPLKEVVSPSGQGEAVAALQLPFQNVPPGKYKLVIETNDTTSVATLQTDLEIVSP